MAQAIDLATIRRQVEDVLDDFLQHKISAAMADRLPEEAPQILHSFLFTGGKRLRPLFCAIGWHAAGGGCYDSAVVRVAASLEMLHAFALIHDDVMDNSATRRGQPSLHRDLTLRHTVRGGASNASLLGVGLAVLVGDLALAWSDELMHTAGLSDAQLVGVLRHVDAMRTELMYGQYLDLVSAGCSLADTESALAIARYKTAKYTIERPLHIGAFLAGADADLCRALSAYALPLGEAFQLRDDLLGVFGDPAQTGKSTVDDLREGKHTVLMALTRQRADAEQLGVLQSLLARPDLDETGADRIRGVVETTGARHAVEQLIRAHVEQARQALEQASLPPAVVAVLHDIAQAATVRDS
ncbi:polyprenyl synthetase family protein [Streptomyces sp. NPDC085524]|uniref:polyprenyl synthetase family protein n=1 Tax=Streptomyces sp. NPDC085524 TaxID=3365728 RepID=UPI0037CDE37F